MSQICNRSQLHFFSRKKRDQTAIVVYVWWGVKKQWNVWGDVALATDLHVVSCIHLHEDDRTRSNWIRCCKSKERMAAATIGGTKGKVVRTKLADLHEVENVQERNEVYINVGVFVGWCGLLGLCR